MGQVRSTSTQSNKKSGAGKRQKGDIAGVKDGSPAIVLGKYSRLCLDLNTRLIKIHVAFLLNNLVKSVGQTSGLTPLMF